MERDLQDQEGLGKFSTDLVIMKQMQHIFDDSLGSASFMYVQRGKVHQLVYYLDDMIIYVTCEIKTPTIRIIQIADQCKDMISKISLPSKS